MENCMGLYGPSLLGLQGLTAFYTVEKPYMFTTSENIPASCEKFKVLFLLVRDDSPVPFFTKLTFVIVYLFLPPYF